jgi:hypothetical protein
MIKIEWKLNIVKKRPLYKIYILKKSAFFIYFKNTSIYWGIMSALISSDNEINTSDNVNVVVMYSYIVCMMETIHLKYKSVHQR